LGVAGACGGSVTVYVAGCNLRCIDCWADSSREDPVLLAPWWTPERVAQALGRFDRHDRILKGTGILRLSGGETFLSASSVRFLGRLRSLIPGPLVVETNGILLGSDRQFVSDLAAMKPNPPFIRLSLKAATPAHFQRITGGAGHAVDLPFSAISFLLRAEAPFDLEAVSLSPELMDSEERDLLVARLRSIHPPLVDRLKEEKLTLYPSTRRRMKASSQASGTRVPTCPLPNRTT